MKETLRKEILTETYKDVQRLIFATVWKFWNIYGGDIDDLIGQAHLIFIDTVDNYDSSRGTKFTSHIAARIKARLFDYMRKGNGYKPHAQIDDEFAGLYLAPNENFSVIELLDEMGQDAHIVLQLFLEMPRDFMVNILNKSGRMDHVQSAVRNRLRNRLRQMGWNVRRIKKAFEEIKGVTNY